MPSSPLPPESDDPLVHGFSMTRQEIIRFATSRYIFRSVNLVASVFFVSFAACIFARKKNPSSLGNLQLLIPFMIAALPLGVAVLRFRPWSRRLNDNLDKHGCDKLEGRSIITKDGVQFVYGGQGLPNGRKGFSWPEVRWLFCANGLAVVVVRNFKTLWLPTAMLPNSSELQSRPSLQRYFRASHWAIRIARTIAFALALIACVGVAYALLSILLFLLGGLLFPWIIR